MYNVDSLPSAASVGVTRDVAALSCFSLILILQSYIPLGLMLEKGGTERGKDDDVKKMEAAIGAGDQGNQI